MPTIEANQVDEMAWQKAKRVRAVSRLNIRPPD
jgi:hypothetical protein